MMHYRTLQCRILTLGNCGAGKPTSTHHPYQPETYHREPVASSRSTNPSTRDPAQPHVKTNKPERKNIPPPGPVISSTAKASR